MNLILCLIGPPGSGKGTHTTRLVQEKPDNLSVSRLSIGDALRARNLPCSSGELCFHSEIEEIIDEHVTEDLDVTILDGYPRSVEQMETVYNRSKRGSGSALIVFNLRVDDIRVLLERLLDRYSCKSCGYTVNRPSGLICPVCGKELAKREDDSDQNAIVRRIEVYQDSFEGIKEFCRSKEVEFVEFDGSKPISEVYSEIKDNFISVVKKYH
jgi:adenylate kinase